MPHQSTNRLHEAARIIAMNPISATLFGLDLLLGRGGAHRLNFRGIHLKVRPQSPDLRVVRTCMLGEFDEAFAVTGDRYGLMVDAGGYLGLVSILFARRFPRSKVVCLEPSSENYRLAKENCAPYPNIDVLNCALAPAPGRLVLKDRGTGQWGFTIAEGVAGEQAAQPIETVDCVTMEQLFERYGADGADMVKLDIEGGEYALLKDRPAWVTRTDLIVAELHDRICPGATEAFEAATAGRFETPMSGEKRMSLSVDAAHATSSRG